MKKLILMSVAFLLCFGGIVTEVKADTTSNKTLEQGLKNGLESGMKDGYKEGLKDGYKAGMKEGLKKRPS